MSRETCFYHINPVVLSIRDSIVVSIPACHAGDRGSIPRHGERFLLDFDEYF